MLSMIQDWKGKIQVNGVLYDTVEQFSKADKPTLGDIHIILYSNTKKPEINTSGSSNTSDEKEQVYRITVKKYMTQKSEPTFDFMAKWNNDNPMPLRTMIGTIDKQTPGMYHMILHGDIYAEKICHCMKCGRVLKNPVSQFFGIGPECGGHNYVNPFEDEEQLKDAVAEYKKQLQNIVWEGWVIKSAITEMEEV